MNRLCLRNNRLKFDTSGGLPIIWGIYTRIYLKWRKKNKKMSTCNRLDLESLGSWPTMPKNFPGTETRVFNLDMFNRMRGGLENLDGVHHNPRHAMVTLPTVVDSENLIEIVPYCQVYLVRILKQAPFCSNQCYNLMFPGHLSYRYYIIRIWFPPTLGIDST
jgi:hypothetical protein